MFGTYLSPDIMAYLQMMQAQHELAESDEQIIKIKPKELPRCAGCGQFMSLDETHLNVMPLGYSHMTEACMTNLVTKIRNSMSQWDWNKFNQINPKPDVIMSVEETDVCRCGPGERCEVCIEAATVSFYTNRS